MVGIIVRAFQLAHECKTTGEIHDLLRNEDFTRIQAHLGGRLIKAQLMRIKADAERWVATPANGAGIITG